LGLAFCMLGWSLSAPGQGSAEWRSWNQPVKPFLLIGNIYYVGASGVTAFLITSPQGHILVDGGFAETAPLILQNIRALGFQPRQVKALVFSHAHADHVGGLAELQRATGAKLVSSERDAEILRSGGKGDFSFGDTLPFPAAQPDRLIRSGETVAVGGNTLVAHITPGHTKGCTSWTMNVREGGREYAVLFDCSTTVPGHQLVNNAAYPEIVADYQASFRTLRALPCDVLLAPHSGFFDLPGKRERLRAGVANPFVNPAECRSFLERSAEEFQKELARQKKLRLTEAVVFTRRGNLRRIGAGDKFLDLPAVGRFHVGEFDAHTHAGIHATHHALHHNRAQGSQAELELHRLPAQQRPLIQQVHAADGKIAHVRAGSHELHFHHLVGQARFQAAVAVAILRHTGSLARAVQKNEPAIRSRFAVKCWFRESAETISATLRGRDARYTSWRLPDP